jgi:sterol desaturase/sphingolipid hydroxylase (fatty acid hydroxylase superfamily)
MINAVFWPLHLVASASAAYVLISLVEYLTHRHLMHRPGWAARLHSRVLRQVFRDHAIVHHRRYYAIFNHEADAHGRTLNLTVKPSTGLAIVAPFCLAAYAIDPLTGALLLVATIMHTFAWSAVHTAMHLDAQGGFARTSLFLYLKRYHYLHHRHPRRNFNALLPMWDWLLGTLAEPGKADRIEMAKARWTVRAPRAAMR